MNRFDMSDEMFAILSTQQRQETSASDDLGFDLKAVYSIFGGLQELTTVGHVKFRSQAEALGVRPGDVLVSANGVDFSKMQSVDRVMSTLSDVAEGFADDGELTLTFQRAEYPRNSEVHERVRTVTFKPNYRYSPPDLDSYSSSDSEAYMDEEAKAKKRLRRQRELTDGSAQ